MLLLTTALNSTKIKQAGYQPHKFNTNPDDINYRKRQPTGDVIKNYFPAVIPEELYYGVQAQYQRNQLHGYGSGKTGKVSNLFSHIAKCGYCGSSMEFIGKGKLPKGGSYLACDSARRELGCNRHYIRYDEFEQLVLTYCRGLNPTDLLPGNEEQETALRVLRGLLSTAEGKAKEAAKEVENLVDSIATTDNPAVRRVLEGRLEKVLDIRVIQPNTEHKLVLDLDREGGRLSYLLQHLDGKSEIIEVISAG